MFQDLDATLRAVLADAAAPPEVRGADVSFDIPDKGFQPAQATLNLFLYDLEENRELRDDAPLIDRQDSLIVSRRAPLRMDCTYLVTAWSARTAGLKAAEEHTVLGLALLWLSRFPVIADQYLQAGLANPPQPYPLPMTLAQLKEGQGTGQFWTALGVSPRPAFSLTVTIAMQPFPETDQYPAVRAVQVATVFPDHPVLSGRVLTSALAPVAGVPVTVVENGLQTTTDQAGRFAFDALAPGPYTLLVQPTGRPELRTPISFAPDGQVHNVILQSP